MSNLSKEQQDVVRGVVKDVKNKQVTTIGGFAGTGKAQPLNSIVYTPLGPKKMGDIKVGDVVCTPDGSVANVIGIFPQGILDIYEIKFRDRTSVECSLDHLWEIYDRGGSQSSSERICTTEYMLNNIKTKRGDKKYHIKSIDFAFFEEKEVLIDPYLLGVLLGDGYLGKSIKLTTADQFVLSEIEDSLETFGVKITYQARYDYRLVNKINAYNNLLISAVKKYKLHRKTAHYKFVPKDYLINSYEVRLSLLQGLMDTDGSVDKKTGMPVFYTTSLRLTRNVKFLIESLGGICVVKIKYTKYNGGKVKSFACHIRFNKSENLFRLPRKKNLCKERTRKTQRGIVDILFSRKAECQCILLDNKDHMYITDNFTKTHNTTVIKTLAKVFENWSVCSYTGMATHVLRKKGLSASTIHSLIYKPVVGIDGKVEFILKDKFELGGEGFLVDESSMVSGDIYHDLVSFNLPIIFVGDHGQLEPIGNNINVMANPDYKLETIHRNAGEIAHFADHIRKGNSPLSFHATEKVIFVSPSDVTDKMLLETDQIICSFNKTRVARNDHMRKLLGFNKVVEVGDRVMCLKNNKNLGIFNGMQGEVIKIHSKNKFDFVADDITYLDIKYIPSTFGQEKAVFEYGKDMPNPFDYAYCCTTHKVQGSQFNNIIVYQQDCDLWDNVRHQYTSASRAIDSIIWVSQKRHIPTWL